MAMVFKRRRFEDSKNDVTELRLSKCKLVDEHDNEKENSSLDKYKIEIESTRYVFSLFIALFLLLPKDLNRLSKLHKRKKSLNHLIYILKICYLEKCYIYFASEFSGRRDLKSKKKYIPVI